jgi:hypothetical protein
MRNCDVALIQELWTYKGEIIGLKKVGGEIIYSRSTQYSRTWGLQPQLSLLRGRGGAELVEKFEVSNTGNSTVRQKAEVLPEA